MRRRDEKMKKQELYLYISEEGIILLLTIS